MPTQEYVRNPYRDVDRTYMAIFREQAAFMDIIRLLVYNSEDREG